MLTASVDRRLSRDQFAREFEGVSRALWSIAAAVLNDRARAEDVVQEAALAAFHKLDEFEAGTSFLAWMGTFVRYTALNEVRKRKMRAASSLDAVDAPIGAWERTESASAAVTSAGQMAPDQRGFGDEVAAALGNLEEVARSCLLLRTIHDLAYKEIAALLDIPEGTAMSHVHRARRVMRESLAGRYNPDSGRRTE